MSELSKELFFLDIEAVVRELSSEEDLLVDRRQPLIRSLEDLAGLLFSIGDDDYAACATELCSKIATGAEPGRLRRLLIEFYNLVSQNVAASRTGSESAELRIRLEALRARIAELGQLPIERLPNDDESYQPSKSKERLGPKLTPAEFDKLDSSTGSGPHEPLITSAFKALNQASDSVSKLVFSTEDQHIEENFTVSDTILSAQRVEPYSVHGESVVSSLPAELSSESSQPSAEVLGVQRDYAYFGFKSGVRRKNDSQLAYEVDKVFAKALATVSGIYLSRPMYELLQTVDALSHQALRLFLPNDVLLDQGLHVNIDHELGLVLETGLLESGVSGVARATNAGSTLFLSISVERASSLHAFATSLSMLGGRLEMEKGTGKIQIVVSSSRRLLRYVPVFAGDQQLAISWAQYIPNPGSSGSASEQLKLLVGEESDVLNVRSVGKDDIGVFFPIPESIRQRDRFRGLVMTRSLSYLPVYG